MSGQPLTEQSLFNQVATHLFQQNARCRDGTKCLYRLGAMRCAAGILIRDEEYQPWMDEEDGNTSFSGIMKDPRCPPSLRERLSPFSGLIISLQNVHDNRQVGEWSRGLAEVAEAHQLTYDPAALIPSESR